jgi:2-oxoglutarate dehydrogenase E2 component (dihydrolipoamide succinyltransferase)
LAGTRPEVVIDSDGSVATRTVAHLGLAYDHRFVNGREAWQFLQAVKELLGTEVTA